MRAPASGVALDLELVRDPGLLFRMSRREIENLSGETRAIAALIASLPWISVNMSVLSAALLSFAVPDRLIDYLLWLHRFPAEIAA